MSLEDKKKIKYKLFKGDPEKVVKEIGKKRIVELFSKLLLIRNFEVRAESAYQMGKVGGFFHSYMGQEAIQTSAVEASKEVNPWWVTTYRCHAIALLLEEPPKELMAELYGKATGNAKGRGGSMHFYSERLLGGFGIVGGHTPIAAGAAFRSKYLNKKEPAFCFLGDGAVAQGAFHESLNLAALWNLPCIYVVENNAWGMGTSVERAIAHQPIAENQAKGYGIEGYSVDGTDFFSCFALFQKVVDDVCKTSRPVIIEALAERFRGHSISDPGLYRTKEELKMAMERDPIARMGHTLVEMGILTDEKIKEIDKEMRQIAVEAMEFAEKSPWPDPLTLEEDVYAP